MTSKISSGAGLLPAHLFDQALRSVATVRGGRQFLEEISKIFDCDLPELLSRLNESESVVVAFADDAPVGFSIATSLLGRSTMLAVYVRPDSRRRGIASHLLRQALLTSGVVDAWALPGDRATKSLFEASRLKARRLTMSVE